MHEELAGFYALLGEQWTSWMFWCCEWRVVKNFRLECYRNSILKFYGTHFCNYRKFERYTDREASEKLKNIPTSLQILIVLINRSYLDKSFKKHISFMNKFALLVHIFTFNILLHCYKTVNHPTQKTVFHKNLHKELNKNQWT